MTHWIGLTGGIGSGKSTAAAWFAEQGITVIDTDAIARKLTADGGAALPELAEKLGSQAVENGRLNRDYVRELVFRHPESKADLEAVLHPMILQQVKQRQAAERDSAYGIVDVPLLTELPLFRQTVSRVLVVDCAEETQILRAIARSQLSREQITAMMAHQASRAERLAIADDVIVNEGSLSALWQQLDVLHRSYLKL